MQAIRSNYRRSRAPTDASLSQGRAVYSWAVQRRVAMRVVSVCVPLVLYAGVMSAQYAAYSLTPEGLRARLAEVSPPDRGLPTNPGGLTDERRAVEGEIMSLRSSDRRMEDIARQVESVTASKRQVGEGLTEIDKTDCRTIPDGPFLPVRRIDDVMYALERTLGIQDPSVWSGAPWRQEQLPTRRFCEIWKRFLGDKGHQDDLLAYFDQHLTRLENERKKQADFAAQATALVDALTKRREAIDSRLSAQETKIKLSDNLWLVIVAIGVFSIGAILAVKLFSERIQIEWVVSGQVIQFVTVMILLSVIMALGLAEVLKENTLGTLLGGVAGYVLAQGVGRAAAREVSREREQGSRSEAPAMLGPSARPATETGK